MKRLITLLFCLVGVVAYGQKQKCGDILVIDAANHIDQGFDSMIWPYIWDIPLSTFNEEFVVIATKNIETDETRYTHLNLIKRGKKDKTISDYLYLWNDAHETLYQVGDKYVEFCPGSSFHNVYVIDESSSDYPLKKNGNLCFAEHDWSERLSSFAFDEFSQSQIVESNRTIRPKDVWQVEYANQGYILSVKSAEKEIAFDWHINERYIQCSISTPNGSETHGIGFSEPDKVGRWTKAIIYDYDYPRDKMVPVAQIHRFFLPNDSYEEYARKGFEIELAEDVNLELAQKYTIQPDEEDIEEESIPFQLSEKKPSFLGGDTKKFTQWVNERLVYPEDAKENCIQGEVLLRFTVDTDGSVTNVIVLRSVYPSLDNEAVRVVSSSPKWEPGKQRERPVKVTYTFPIGFYLRGLEDGAVILKPRKGFLGFIDRITNYRWRNR